MRDVADLFKNHEHACVVKHDFVSPLIYNVCEMDCVFNPPNLNVETGSKICVTGAREAMAVGGGGGGGWWRQRTMISYTYFFYF